MAPPKADVGISDVFYETRGFGSRPSTVADYPGPAQAILFAVPFAATGAPSSITATTLTGMNPSVAIADRTTAIGFLAADAFDTQRAKMHALAFLGLEQT